MHINNLNLTKCFFQKGNINITPRIHQEVNLVDQQKYQKHIEEIGTTLAENKQTKTSIKSHHQFPVFV